MKIKTMASVLLLLLASVVLGYATKYTGYVVDLGENNNGDVYIGLDGGGDGVVDLGQTYTEVSDEEYQTLQDAKREGKQVTLNFHTVIGPPVRVVLDGVQLHSGIHGISYIEINGKLYWKDANGVLHEYGPADLVY